MKITIEDIKLEDGSTETRVFKDVEDAYIAIRFPEMYKTKDDSFIHLLHTRSFSFGPAIRELLKELRQSIGELEQKLREIENGNPGEL